MTKISSDKNTCSCGYDINDYHIHPKCEYSSFGWILYWIGMSAQPVKIDFVCDVCGEILRSTTEPGELKKYVGR